MANWDELSGQEKREERFKRWLSPKVKFANPQAEKLYKERLTRFIKAVKMEIPDRVPVQIPGGSFPAHYSGTTLQALMYDYDVLKKAWLKFINDFDMDLYDSAGLIFSGRVYEILDYKLYQWPGHGLPADTSMHQFVEGEYMKADEYDAFIKDPFDFSLRYFLPRTWGTLAPLSGMPRFNSALGLPFQLMAICSNPEFQKDALQTISEAVNRMKKMIQSLSALPSQLELELKECDLNELINDTVHELGVNGLFKVKIERHLGQVSSVKADGEEIQKVVQNLLLNACEAMDSEGCVKVSSRANEDHIVFSVTDNGRGMSEEFVKNSLFRPG